MEPRRLAKTNSRSVLGVMNEFKYLAEIHAKLDGETDLLALSLQLAQTPCGPLYKRHISPDGSGPRSSHQPTESILDRDIEALSDSPTEHFN